jgi:hypothetical protein
MDLSDPYVIAAAWMGLALAASLISIRIGIAVALVEIFMGSSAATRVAGAAEFEDAEAAEEIDAVPAPRR